MEFDLILFSISRTSLIVVASGRAQFHIQIFRGNRINEQKSNGRLIRPIAST